MASKIITVNRMKPCPHCGRAPVVKQGKTLFAECCAVMWGRDIDNLRRKWNRRQFACLLAQ